MRISSNGTVRSNHSKAKPKNVLHTQLRSCWEPVAQPEEWGGVAQLTPGRTPQLTHPTQSMDMGSQVKLCLVLARQENMYIGDRIDLTGANCYLQEVPFVVIISSHPVRRTRDLATVSPVRFMTLARSVNKIL